MISEKDAQFLDYLVTATENGKITWQPTANDNQFTTSFKGKYNVLVGTGRDGAWLKMSNDQDQVMLFISNTEDQLDRVERLFEGARRIALSVDTAIDEIIQGE